ncbi:MAG TPA: hypothetical protein VK399_07045 [Longimicrobiaceae bacterium]|nr:hypothetical protein [Longimicrobiaceae bacterium]
MRLLRLPSGAALLLLLAAWPAALPAQGPVFPGERIRVWPRNPRLIQPDLRLLTPASRAQEGVVLSASEGQVVMEIDSRVATVLHVGVGHWTTEHTVRLEDLERMEVHRGQEWLRPGRRRVLLAAGTGVLLGTLLGVSDGECNGEPCTSRQSVGFGVAAGLLAGGVVLALPRERWVEVPLP